MISDHAAIDVTFAPLRSGESRNIVPRHICRQVFFSEMVQKYADDLQLLDLPVEQQLSTFKSVLLEAARRTRDQLLDKDGALSDRLIVGSIARAVWKGALLREDE